MGVYAQLLRDFLRKMDARGGEGLQVDQLRELLVIGRSMTADSSRAARERGPARARG